jgi:hypothetical protein
MLGAFELRHHDALTGFTDATCLAFRAFLEAVESIVKVFFLGRGYFWKIAPFLVGSRVTKRT